MAGYPTLETERLRLVPVTLADAPAIQAIFPQWDIVRWLDVRVPWPYPADGAETFLREVLLPGAARGEWWSWTIRAKADPARLLGLIDLRDAENDHRGFWIDPAVRGRGYMSEAADAVTDYWFDMLKRPLLRVPKAADNIGSRRISEKQGMRHVGTIEKDYVSGRLRSEVWEITAEEWRARSLLRRRKIGLG